VTGSKGREGKGREVEGKGQTLPQSDKALQEAEAARAYESIEKLLNLAVPIPFAPIRGWLDAGFDLDRDIVPAITEVVSRQRSKVPAWKPGSLRYFDQAVRTAHADRIGSGRSNGTVTGPKPADTPEGERKLLEVKAKILNAGTRYEDTTQTEVDAMIAAKLTTPEKARAMGFRA
jgi:hypothetical protein